MSIYQELSYDSQVDTIKGIRFCILSPDEIKRMSVVEITTSETYDGKDPVPNGLYDPRMGVLDHNKICPTCQQKNTFCPGHFGHITLAKPVFYIQFFDTVKKLMKCVCFRCSKLLLDPEGEVVKTILNKKILTSEALGSLVQTVFQSETVWTGKSRWLWSQTTR